MADTTKTNTEAIIGFNLFDGVEIRGTGPEAEYPVLAVPLVGTAKNEEPTDAVSHSTLNVSLFDC